MENQPQGYMNDEITLRDLILKVKEYFIEIIRKWWIIALVMIPIVGYFLYQHYQTPTTYPTELTFMVNEDEGNSVSSIGSILGQIGVGSAGKRSRYNLDKILQLSKTRKILGKAAFDSCVIDGKNDFIANHIISMYQLNEKWASKNPKFEGFRFRHSKLDDFEQKESIAFKKIIGLIAGNPSGGREGIVSNSYNEVTGIMTLSAKTLNPYLSVHLIQSLYYHLGKFYIENSTEKQQVTFDLVSAKKDSILNALQSAEYALASFRESNRNMIDSRSKLNETRLNREVIVGTQAYVEAVKNVEFSDFALKNMTPFIQPIDEPMLPIAPVSSSLLITLIKSIIIGGLVGALFVILRKIFKDAMQGS
jgi:uncharacterized protein involved in exopolysaccharide biosynthesis